MSSSGPCGKHGEAGLPIAPSVGEAAPSVNVKRAASDVVWLRGRLSDRFMATQIHRDEHIYFMHLEEYS
jgi:hypothetical protein